MESKSKAADVEIKKSKNPKKNRDWNQTPQTPPEFKLCWMKLCSSNNHYTTALIPQTLQNR